MAAPEPYAVTYGTLTPRVAISTGLLNTLTDSELDAVLTHESVHVQRRDPLRIAVARIAAPRRFLIPIMRPLYRRFLIGSKLAADRKAIERHGHRPLAAALLKVVDLPRRDATSAAAMAEAHALDACINQNGDRPREWTPKAVHHRLDRQPRRHRDPDLGDRRHTNLITVICGQ